jgi:hypothetical protein
MRCVRWAGIATGSLILLAGAAFWRWPLHIQAHFRLLGDILSERPTPDEWSTAAYDPSEEPPSSRSQTQAYFPERIFHPAFDGTPFMELMLAREMQRFEESSLYLRRTNASTHIYRLTWHRSFDPAIVVRLEVEPDGTVRLFSKHFALRPVGTGKTTQREEKLSRREASSLIGKFERSGFWTATAEGEDGGLDGAMWLFEGCRGGRYHVVKRWSPENGDPFKSLGLDLLEAAGFWRGPVY